MFGIKSIVSGIIILSALLIAPLTVSADYTMGIVTGDRVNVRTYAQISDGNINFQVSRGESIVIHDVDGDFYRASINGTDNVFIHRDFVRVAETRGVINTSFVWVFSLPSQYGGEAITMFEHGMDVTVISRIDQWLGIDYNGETVFINEAFVDIPDFVELQVANIQRIISGSSAADVVAFAKNYLGARYVWGGTTPNGFDCSGFMLYIMRHFGVELNRTSRDQARNGVEVSRADLEQGDLVFFTFVGGRISHVGMYIGGGEFIHSSTNRHGVIISNLNSSYNSRAFVTARRVL